MLLHSAGIIRDDKSFLFTGPSGAGKSTISEISNNLSYKIIHDDHIVLYKDLKNTYRVADQSLKISGVPLKAIFFLQKDSTDKLIALTQSEVVSELIKRNVESFAGPILRDEFLRTVFSISSDVARNTPCFKLHFTKSPDFWALIKDELKL